ncbi:hypothetical protein OH491_24930 [Termitidicoccus mucosus]|uniref:Uncharacterized protein n=1 Tax=Termitidicoccus mucosus TaxID=1184151 RepID=A0A178IPD2_9BACT|nr:hypothetical protein AW736_01610 [Opitutaceae bacterium TSB47]
MNTNTTPAAGQLELPVATTPEPGKTNHRNTTAPAAPDNAPDFSEFLDAAISGSTGACPQPATPGDDFDTIETAAKIFHEQLEKLKTIFKETASRNPFKKNTRDYDSDNPFKYIEEDTLDKLHEKISDLLLRFYTGNCLTPTGRIIGSDEPLETFCKAAQFEPSLRNKYPPLDQITAAALREAFLRLYGDPVESRVRQLRQATAHYIGGHRRTKDNTLPSPFNDRGILSFRSGLHQEATMNPRKKTLTYQHEYIANFTNFLRLCHFALTGEFIIPDESWKLKLPYGMDHLLHEFESALLFRRQVAPASGIKWLRFAACNYVEILLEPKVDAYFRALIEECRNNREPE